MQLPFLHHITNTTSTQECPTGTDTTNATLAVGPAGLMSPLATPLIDHHATGVVEAINTLALLAAQHVGVVCDLWATEVLADTLEGIDMARSRMGSGGIGSEKFLCGMALQG